VRKRCTNPMRSGTFSTVCFSVLHHNLCVSVPYHDLTVGFVSGIAASIAFWLIMFTLRPKIAISTHIAKELVGTTSKYRIKIVNLGRRAAEDVEVRVFVVKEIDEGVDHLNVVEVDGKSGYTLGRYSRRDESTRYARRIILKDFDPEASWTDDTQQLLIRVYARDGVSGLRKETERRIPRLDAIKAGNFKVGNSFEISTS
jgi:hypothetical protein